MGIWHLDPYHTQIGFSAKHLGMMTVRGHFTDVTAIGDIDPDNPDRSAVEVTIAMSSITTNHAQRDGDLRSSNFLEVETHPTATFSSTAIKQTGTDEFSVTVRASTRSRSGSCNSASSSSSGRNAKAPCARTSRPKTSPSSPGRRAGSPRLPAESAPNAWRRHLHLILDGFRAERAGPLAEPPLTPEQLYQAMVRFGGIRAFRS